LFAFEFMIHFRNNFANIIIPFSKLEYGNNFH
jgi:hypothetical protein